MKSSRSLVGVVAALAVAGLTVGLALGSRAHGASADGRLPKAATVEHAWRPGTTQLGIDVLYYSSGDLSASQIALQARRDINYVVGLGGNAISIAFPFYTLGSKSTTVFAGPGTPSSGQLGSIVQAASASGLRVSLRPLLDQGDLNAGVWRGTITPTSPRAWLASYGMFLKPYLQMAASDHVATFVLGSELSGLQGSPYWQQLVGMARQLYHGQLAYSENWDVFHLGWPTPPVTLSVDFYPPMNAKPAASVRELDQQMIGWWSTPKHQVDDHGLVLSEVGLAAQDGAYKTPWEIDLQNAAFNPAVQATWFEATCEVTHQRHFAGLYFWNIPFTSNDYVRSQPSSFVGRPGEKEIKKCFDSFA